MPIYEEKLICPLAVRFSQEHIRPVFQEGSDIESAIKEIKATAGVGDYDVVLHAPFPAIEILRWRPHRAPKSSNQSTDSEADHWVTLDNRRLYCLQRVAVALWPKRVAIIVEALYAATDGAHRKTNSSTAGRSVCIGHSLKMLLGCWDWREEVGKRMAADAYLVKDSFDLVNTDDSRSRFEELLDAPAPPSMLDLYFQEESGKVPAGGSESSTADPSSPRSMAASIDSTSVVCPSVEWMVKDPYADLREAFRGMWRDARNNTYQVKPTASPTLSWSCVKTEQNGSGTKKFTLWYDKESDCICWGNDWSHYSNADELRQQREKLAWFGGQDLEMKRRKFAWEKVKDTSTPSKAAAQKQPSGGSSSRADRHPGRHIVASEGRAAKASSTTVRA